MGRPLADAWNRIRRLVPELIKFGIVGGLGTIIDVGGAAVLHGACHQGPFESKAISITAATAFTYLGNRFWAFRYRENQPVHREATLFVALNVVGLVIAELVIAGTTYGLGLKGQLAYNAASLAGTGLGTIFRWFAYRKWVFLAPAAQPSPHPQSAGAGAHFPHYAPRELDPAYLTPAYSARPGEGFSKPGFDGPFIPNVPMMPPLLTTAASAGRAARPAPSPRPVGAGPRAPGRHRKR